jgi:hypoxanthine phosphoribosyltransferase
MLFRDINGSWYENDKQTQNTLCGQNVNVLYIAGGGCLVTTVLGRALAAADVGILKYVSYRSNKHLAKRANIDSWW